jgi:hypothetical protein
MAQFEKPPVCPSCSADAGEDFIAIHSGVGGPRRNGFVHLAWASLRAQFTPAQARAHALRVLEAAEAAESDAAVLKLLEVKIGLDTPRSLGIIADLRNFRDAGDETEGEK